MKIEIKNSPQHGMGVFATEYIQSGEAILLFTGPIVHLAEIQQDSYHLQIGEDIYLGASGGADDYVNHSCDPNSGFSNGLRLTAIRDIHVGEEITWDYSTSIDEDDFSGFPCDCGSSQCRGTVLSFRNLDAKTQERLRPWLLPYLLDKYYFSENGRRG